MENSISEGVPLPRATGEQAAFDTMLGDIRANPRRASLAPGARQLAKGLALASVFGVSLGLREGGWAIPIHGVGVPLGLVAVVALGAPAFLIGLLHAGLRIDAVRVFEMAVRAIGTAGSMLGGLAPLAALVLVSSEETLDASIFAWLALVTSGALAVRTLFREVQDELLTESGWERLLCDGGIRRAMGYLMRLKRVVGMGF
ncbi:MAG: hypothetical protein JW751_26035, partial [Polyangiaceae bacterium]|nr:hypothetical protein [Polyangiaceae bacterium]